MRIAFFLSDFDISLLLGYRGISRGGLEEVVVVISVYDAYNVFLME